MHDFYHQPGHAMHSYQRDPLPQRKGLVGSSLQTHQLLQFHQGRHRRARVCREFRLVDIWRSDDGVGVLWEGWENFINLELCIQRWFLYLCVHCWTQENKADISYFQGQRYKVTKNEAIREEKFYPCCVEPYLNLKFTLGLAPTTKKGIAPWISIYLLSNWISYGGN